MSLNCLGCSRRVRARVVSVVVGASLLSACGSDPGSGAGSGGGPNTGGGRNTGGQQLVGGSGQPTGGSGEPAGGRSSGGGATGGAVGAGGTPASGGKQEAPGGSDGSGGDPAEQRDILAPEDGALLGLYYGDGNLSSTADKLQRTPPLHLVYYAWDDQWTRGDTVSDLENGRIPFVNWELYNVIVSEILEGQHDAVIQARAEEAAALKEPFFLDFGAEMNGDWSPWGGPENGMSADAYLALYRKVHDAFVHAGATNVIWAFCPNVTDVPDADWNEALDYYPGDEYVDWMCVDGYNWGGAEWQDLSQVFAKIYPLLASKQKPIMIGEMASSEEGGNKADFIAGIVPTLKTQYPLIKGLIWFDINKEEDWRISSSAESEAAFLALAQDEYFNP